jgi:hypothetical protein
MQHDIYLKKNNAANINIPTAFFLEDQLICFSK